MIRRWLLLAACALLPMWADAADIIVTDDLGKIVRLSAPAKRIVSLYSAHTENLFALGLSAEIVGVGRSDAFPPEVAHKPRFDYRTDPEKLIAVAPDLVLIRPFIARSQPQFVEILERAGVAVVALYPERFEDFDGYIRRLAQLTGTAAQAETLLRQFHRDIEAIQASTAPISPKARVFFEASADGCKTVTPDSLPARAIAIAGGVNIAADAAPVKQGSSIAAYGVEKLLEQGENIDVYLVQTGAMNPVHDRESVAARPGFQAIKAVRDGRIYLISEQLISSPTFRYAQGIREVLRICYSMMIEEEEAL